MEQVVAVAPRIADLAAGCPELTILTTSREALRVRGEHEYAVPPLPTPERAHEMSLPELAGNPAVALFVRQAQAIRGDFALTADHAVAVAGICTRLDGLPLAIELAASRSKVLSPNLILARLDRRLSLLVHGHRDLPARLQTMRDAIAWSYDLLPPVEQALFCRLSVFAGRFSLDAAEAIGGDDEALVLDGLTSLVEKSLLNEVVRDGSSRFVMYQTIREFATEQLDQRGEAEAQRRRHALWILGLAERAMPEFFGWAAGRGLAWLDAEIDNIRAAVSWALARGEAEIAQRLMSKTNWYWYVSGQAGEGAMWSERAAMSGPTPPAVRAELLLTLAWLLNEHGDVARALPYIDESLALARVDDQPWLEAMVHHGYGLIALSRGELDRSRAEFTAALSIFESLQESTWIPFQLKDLGLIDYLEGDLVRADARLTEALTLFRQMGNNFGTSVTLINFARLALRQGDLPGAAKRYGESLSLRWADGDKISVLSCLRGLATTAAFARQPERAVRLFAAEAALREAIDARAPRPSRLESGLAAARDALSEATFTAYWAAGRGLALPDAVHEALAVSQAIQSHDTSTGERDDYGLTARELDVLRLLVAGRSNPEIASALFISRRTVTTHVTNLFTKLGVSNRVEATIAALQRRAGGLRTYVKRLWPTTGRRRTRLNGPAEIGRLYDVEVRVQAQTASRPVTQGRLPTMVTLGVVAGRGGPS